MTPLFCFTASIFYLWHDGKKRQLDYFLCLLLYAILNFLGSLRTIAGPGFESALVTEKILLFVLLERGFFWLKERKSHSWMAGFLIAGVFVSTASFSLRHFIKRHPTLNKGLVALHLPAMESMRVPAQQAADFQSVSDFISRHTRSADKILFLPDLGVYNFIVHRPFSGRFPVASLAWLGDGWDKELLASLSQDRPKYIFVPQKLPDYFIQTHLSVRSNRRKYEDLLRFINAHYRYVTEVGPFNVLICRSS